MPLVTNISNFATRVATEFRTIRTIITGSSTGDLTGLQTTAKSSIVAAINEVKAGATGGATTLDGLTDVAITTAAVGHILRHNGTEFVNVLGDTYYQPRDSDLDAIAALTTTPYGRAFLSLADQASLMGLLSSASATAEGKIELATQAEVDTGTDAVRAVTPATLASRLSAAYQPLDSDLTAIAALTTTAYGRGFLSLANQAALVGLLPQATTTQLGVNTLATNAETQAGTDTVKATTSAGTKAAIDQRIVNDNTLGGGSPSTTNAPSVSSVKAYADALIGANDAMVFKGVIDASTNPNYPAANRGDTYRVSVAGKIGGASGPNVEVGDLLIALNDGTAAGTHATVGANWNITQANIDGAVTGPASSVSGNLATFNGATGKVVQDSGFTPSNAAIGAGSATVLPTSAQVVAYAQPIDADLTAIAALVSAADRVPYSTGAGTWAMATFTAFGRSLLGAVDAAAARTTLDVYSKTEIGDPETNFVTAFNTALTA